MPDKQQGEGSTPSVSTNRRKWNRMTNCKNCGAPIVGSLCEYCGSRIENPELEAAKRELEREIRDVEYHQRMQEIMLSSFCTCFPSNAHSRR